MPLSKFTCSICGARCPKKYLAEGHFKDRMAWLRRHRKRKHPTAHQRSVEKTLETKSRRGTVGRKHKQTRKQRAASLRNLKKARAARRKKH